MFAFYSHSSFHPLLSILIRYPIPLNWALSTDLQKERECRKWQMTKIQFISVYVNYFFFSFSFPPSIYILLSLRYERIFAFDIVQRIKDRRLDLTFAHQKLLPESHNTISIDTKVFRVRMCLQNQNQQNFIRGYLGFSFIQYSIPFVGPLQLLISCLFLERRSENLRKIRKVLLKFC